MFAYVCLNMTNITIVHAILTIYTLRPVVGHLAVLGARALAQAAGVDTFLVLTRLSRGTLTVVTTAHCGS